MSTLTRKAWGDLTRHRARTLLATFTLCIAIASAGFLAVPALLNAAMNRQVQQSHLDDVELSTRTLDLSPAQLSALGHLPGVAAVATVLGYVTEATTSSGPRNVELLGGDLASSPVDTVPLLTGRMPGRVRSWPTWPTAGPPTSPSGAAPRYRCGPPAARWCRFASAAPG